MTLSTGWNDRAITGPLMQLLYCSRSLIGAGSVLQMSGILAEARPANARDDITGVLTAVEGRFIQIIEGTEIRIEDLMARLTRDPRHSDIRVIERRAIHERAFGDWDMVSPRLAALELSRLKALIDTGAADLDKAIALLSRAIAQQSAVLEGRSRPDQITSRRQRETSAQQPGA